MFLILYEFLLLDTVGVGLEVSAKKANNTQFCPQEVDQEGYLGSQFFTSSFTYKWVS